MSNIRVVVLTGGPTLEFEVVAFLEMLEDDPEIELAGVFSQSPQRGASGIVRDLWQRRGLLSAPIILLNTWSYLWHQVTSPHVSRRHRQVRRNLRERTHYVDDLHSHDVIACISELNPGLALVYGGPIIKPCLFQIPDRGTLGIHHGKVPDYRGKKTTFWAIYNGETEVGVTIQRLCTRLDGGDIVMQALLPVAKQPLGRIKRLLQTTGIDLYIRAIHAVRTGTATFTVQPPVQAILYRDPTAADIIRFWYRYMLRLVQN